MLSDPEFCSSRGCITSSTLQHCFSSWHKVKSWIIQWHFDAQTWSLLIVCDGVTAAWCMWLSWIPFKKPIHHLVRLTFGIVSWNRNLPLFHCDIESGGGLFSSWHMINIVEFAEHRCKLKAGLWHTAQMDVVANSCQSSDITHLSITHHMQIPKSSFLMPSCAAIDLTKSRHCNCWHPFVHPLSLQGNLCLSLFHCLSLVAVVSPWLLLSWQNSMLHCSSI